MTLFDVWKTETMTNKKKPYCKHTNPPPKKVQVHMALFCTAADGWCYRALLLSSELLKAPLTDRHFSLEQKVVLCPVVCTHAEVTVSQSVSSVLSSINSVPLWGILNLLLTQTNLISPVLVNEIFLSFFKCMYLFYKISNFWFIAFQMYPNRWILVVFVARCHACTVTSRLNHLSAIFQ